MSLMLTLEGVDTLENGQPVSIALDRHGAVLGRSLHADWCLPDATKRISSRHCEISYRDAAYLLIDHSTNGTYLNGAAERLTHPHCLADGDCFTIGQYRITARHAGARVGAAPLQADTLGWDDFAVPEPIADEGWAANPDPKQGEGAGWRTVPVPAPAVSGGAWDMPAPVVAPSAWSSAPSQPGVTPADDIWGKLAQQSDIDWSRGGFAPLAVSEEKPPAPEAAEPGVGHDWARFVDASGLPTDQLMGSPDQALQAAGAILRQLVSGVMLMIDARARTKAQLGVQATGLELEGNNPLKFVRSPERALLQLLDTPQPGFMAAERAVEDAFQDLQAHQMATLSAMQSALKETLSRLSPQAIEAREHRRSRLERWFPALRRARHWEAYQRDFEGVVRGSDEAFMDVFAKAFRLHYDRQIATMKRQRTMPVPPGGPPQ